MGYCEAMEFAGAEVLEYQSFGSYQGDWFAKVLFEGKIGWVHGSYGSCSHCDAFESEFDYDRGPECSEHRYEDGSEGCEHCHAAKADYDKR